MSVPPVPRFGCRSARRMPGYGDIREGDDLAPWTHRVRAAFRDAPRRTVYEEWLEKCYSTGFAHGWELHRDLGAWHAYAIIGIRFAEAIGWIERCDAPWHPPEAILHNHAGESLDVARVLRSPSMWHHLPPTSWGWSPARDMVPAGRTLAEVIAEVLR